ncbi:MAG: hypothetical protein ACREI8_09940 [Myxococcota bacterium]
MRFGSALALVCSALVGAGCFSIQVVSGNQVPAARVGDIRPGETSKAQILDWFGAPEDYTDPSGLRRVLDDGVVLPEDVLALPYADVLVFETTHGRVKGVVLILFNWFDIHVVSDRLVVFFDDQDRVLYYGYRSGGDELE